MHFSQHKQTSDLKNSACQIYCQHSAKVIHMTFGIVKLVQCSAFMHVTRHDIFFFWLCVYVYLAFEWPNCGQQEKHLNKQIKVNFVPVYHPSEENAAKECQIHHRRTENPFFIFNSLLFRCLVSSNFKTDN